MNFNQYLTQEIPCNCGKQHLCTIEQVTIEEKALEKIPEFLTEKGYLNCFVVSDQNTELAAASRVKEILGQHKINFDEFIFQDKELVPDEKAVGTLFIQVPENCHVILAVGGGTINDLCRFVSSKIKIPYIIIATAPSMDGFASNVSPLIVNHMKTTYEIKNKISNGMPKAIFGDLDVLAQAPMEMIAAGVGDILGKYVCIADWKISHIITEEYFCPQIAGLIEESIEKIVKAAPLLIKRDKKAIEAVMEGLVLSGIAMSFVGNSRPASGSEHHVSHYWEMMSLQQGSHGALHGIKVGIGTILCLNLYKQLAIDLSCEDTRKKIMEKPYVFQKEKWRASIEEAYGIAAAGVLLLEENVEKNKEETVLVRRKKLFDHLDDILQLIQKLPDSREIQSILEMVQAPVKPEQIQVTENQVKNSILYGKDLRNRFGLLQMLHDLQLNS